MNQQKLQMFMLCLRSIYASMTFNCPLMLNKVGSEKIPLPGLSHPFLGMGPGPIELGKFAAF